MNILFSTNTWLYDIMIRSYPIFKQMGIGIFFDIVLSSHYRYLTKCYPKNTEIKYSLFYEYVIERWGEVDTSDKNIKYLENKYDMLLNELIIYDLAMIKYKEIPYSNNKNEFYWRRYFVATVEYYENLLEQSKPDFIFGEGPHGIGMKILFEISRKKSIPFFTILGSYLEGKICFGYGRSGKNIALEYFYNNPNKLNEEDFKSGENLINLVKIEKQLPYYQRRYGKRVSLLPSKVSIFFNTLIRTLSYLRKKCNNHLLSIIDCDYNPLWKSIFNRWERFSNYRFILNNSCKENFEEDYIVYFNHYQPEATTSVWAPYYENQYNTIENIAKSISGTLKLYIKEHTTDLSNRGKEFYRNLFLYPNVKLINPFSNSSKLIEHCKMVFTISGTCGFEAIMMGKPVGVFSNCYYSFFPGVFRIQKFDDIPRALNWGLNSYKPDQKLIKIFAASYSRSQYETTISYPKLEDNTILENEKLVARFVRGITEFIEDFKKFDWDKCICNLSPRE